MPRLLLAMLSRRLTMRRRARIQGAVLLLALAWVLPGRETAMRAQQTPSSFTVDRILSQPTPDNLISSPVGSMIAWTFNERGVRNIYVAEGPGFAASKVSSYRDDDGQELPKLLFSSDGKTLVYVRGGDHGSNRPGDPPPNPSGNPVQPRIQIWSMAAAGGEPKLIGEGDEPA